MLSGHLEPVRKSIVINATFDIVRRVLPKDVFASKKNQKQFFSELNNLLRANKFQTISAYGFEKSLSEPAPQWLLQMAPFFRNILVRKLVNYLVVELTLKNTLMELFYISESGSTGFQLHYYLKSQVESACSLKLNVMEREGILSKCDGANFEKANVNSKQ